MQEMNDLPQKKPIKAKYPPTETKTSIISVLRANRLSNACISHQREWEDSLQRMPPLTLRELPEQLPESRYTGIDQPLPLPTCSRRRGRDRDSALRCQMRCSKEKLTPHLAPGPRRMVGKKTWRNFS